MNDRDKISECCPACQGKWINKRAMCFVCPNNCQMELYFSLSDKNFGLYKKINDNFAIWYRDTCAISKSGSYYIICDYVLPFNITEEQLKLYIIMS